MSKYLRLFETSAEYTTYSESGDMILPNVSYCEDINGVFYNPYVRDYSKEYLTFEVVESGTVTFKTSSGSIAKTIQYSKDNGETWTSITSSTTAQALGGTLAVGDKVLVKGTNSAYADASSFNQFGGTAKVNVYGNIMSLIYGDNFANNTTLSDSYTFRALFYQYANLLSTEHLILPATTLTDNCYNSMFSGCTSLVTAPELPATTLTERCYSYMFESCTSLNYIKAMFTTTPGSNYTSVWVYGVASSGTFVKNSAATWTVTGNNGIPSGWTVETASA